ncbi:MAG: DUF4167 domain-containing protein [Novosphingobium sp.]|nr:DUF4167 domain-containing protein [Novosphingobium sp.]
MNNNRGNNRRRGRGNNRQQGGGQQLNRIDSRARGNAPQLLEKYRKLAHDAHLNGDRVTEEYYLQFADHYFRVIADTRQRQEEQRARREERWQEGGESWREDTDEAAESGADADDAYGYGRDPYPSRRDDRPRREERDTGREPREARNGYGDVPPPVGEAAITDDTGESAGGEQSGGQASLYEPAENPFTRDARGSRGLKPRRAERQPRRKSEPARAESVTAENTPAESARENGDDQLRFDPATLPPAIGVSNEAAAQETAEAAEGEAPKPKRRTRKPKAPVDDAGEALAAVSSE